MVGTARRLTASLRTAASRAAVCLEHVALAARHPEAVEPDVLHEHSGPGPRLLGALGIRYALIWATPTPTPSGRR